MRNFKLFTFFAVIFCFVFGLSSGETFAARGSSKGAPLGGNSPAPKDMGPVTAPAGSPSLTLTSGQVLTGPEVYRALTAIPKGVLCRNAAPGDLASFGITCPETSKPFGCDPILNSVDLNGNGIEGDEGDMQCFSNIPESPVYSPRFEGLGVDTSRFWPKEEMNVSQKPIEAYPGYNVREALEDDGETVRVTITSRYNQSAQKTQSGKGGSLIKIDGTLGNMNGDSDNSLLDGNETGCYAQVISNLICDFLELAGVNLDSVYALPGSKALQKKSFNNPGPGRPGVSVNPSQLSPKESSYAAVNGVSDWVNPNKLEDALTFLVDSSASPEALKNFQAYLQSEIGFENGVEFSVDFVREARANCSSDNKVYAPSCDPAVGAPAEDGSTGNPYFHIFFDSGSAFSGGTKTNKLLQSGPESLPYNPFSPMVNVPQDMVILANFDGCVDINHPDLRDRIYFNQKEMNQDKRLAADTNGDGYSSSKESRVYCNAQSTAYCPNANDNKKAGLFMIDPDNDFANGTGNGKDEDDNWLVDDVYGWNTNEHNWIAGENIYKKFENGQDVTVCPEGPYSKDHGTQTAGLAVSQFDNAQGILSSPNGLLYPFVVLDGEGYAAWDTIARMNWALFLMKNEIKDLSDGKLGEDLGNEHQARIIGLHATNQLSHWISHWTFYVLHTSVQGPDWSETNWDFQEDPEKFVGSITSVGNGNVEHSGVYDWQTGEGDPGADFITSAPGMLTVGGHGLDGLKDPNANFGDHIDYSLPSTNVYSTIRGTGYGYFNGTSIGPAYLGSLTAALRRYADKRIADTYTHIPSDFVFTGSTAAALFSLAADEVDYGPSANLWKGWGRIDAEKAFQATERYLKELDAQFASGVPLGSEHAPEVMIFGGLFPDGVNTYAEVTMLTAFDHTGFRKACTVGDTGCCNPAQYSQPNKCCTPGFDLGCIDNNEDGVNDAPTKPCAPGDVDPESGVVCYAGCNKGEFILDGKAYNFLNDNSPVSWTGSKIVKIPLSVEPEEGDYFRMWTAGQPSMSGPAPKSTCSSSADYSWEIEGSNVPMSTNNYHEAHMPQN